MARDSNPGTTSLADRLRPLLREREAQISLGEMVDRIDGDEGIAPVLLVLTLPVLLPLPPGVSMVMALPIVLVAPQMMVGRRAPWLPGWLARRTIKHGELVKLLDRMLPVVERVETVVRPRLRLLSGRTGEAMAGFGCTLMGLVLVLPIPFANLLPSWSVGAFSLGLTRRDGLFVLAGYALLIAAFTVIGVAALGVDFGWGRLRALL